MTHELKTPAMMSNYKTKAIYGALGLQLQNLQFSMRSSSERNEGRILENIAAFVSPTGLQVISLARFCEDVTKPNFNCLWLEQVDYMKVVSLSDRLLKQ